MRPVELLRNISSRLQSMQESKMLLILAFFTGLLSGCAAVLLKYLIHFFEWILRGWFNTPADSLLYLIYPGVGMLLSLLVVKYLVKDDISHGVTKVLLAVSKNESKIKGHNTWSSMLSSSMTIGFGGSVGAEAPIVLTGAAIGSNLGRLFRMEQKTLMLLVGCGVAGAVAGIFKAPIAGLVFVIEVLMLDLTMTSVMPLLISSVTAATVSYIFTGTDAMFKFSQTEVFEISRIPYVLLLGVCCGLLSLYFTRVMNKVEGVFRKVDTFWKKFILGGAMLSVLIFLFPPLYGEGYDTISSLLSGQYAHIMDKSLFYGMKDSYWGVLLFLFFILLTKVFASSATNGGGGCGGIFAPSLFLGCIVGFMFAHASNYFEFTRYLSEKNFALLGMAGVMAGVMHAPLTGVFLIAELTGGYDLFLPLMIVAISSYLTIIVFEPHSIYSMRLAQKGELLTHHKDKAVLTLLNADNIIERDFLTVTPDMTLGDMVKVIAQSKRNAFPVVNKEGVLLGVVLLDNIRNIMFRPELYDRFKVSKFLVSAPAKIVLNTPMEKVMRVFDDTKAWNLPVVDESGRYIGFMSKSKIFNSYREVLVDHFSED